MAVPKINIDADIKAVARYRLNVIINGCKVTGEDTPEMIEALRQWELESQESVLRSIPRLYVSDGEESVCLFAPLEIVEFRDLIMTADGFGPAKEDAYEIYELYFFLENDVCGYSEASSSDLIYLLREYCHRLIWPSAF